MYAQKGKHFGSISKRKGVCARCGGEGTYGMRKKYYCRKCFIEHYGVEPEKMHSKNGNAGMVPFKTKEELEEALSQTYMIEESFRYPYMLKVTKGNKVFASLYLTHYPNSKGIVGRCISYLIIWRGKVVGIMGGNSSPYSVKPVDKFFNIIKENRSDKLLEIFNNEVFRIISSEKNLATMALKSFRKAIKRDYKEKYGMELKGLITFVEPPRDGAIYKADNWTYLGMTKGYGTTKYRRWDDRKWIKKTPKHIYAKKL